MRSADYAIDPQTGCWDWLGSIKSDTGYGVSGRGERRKYAHRVSYELHVGPIPEGLVIDHLCRNRACVNPEHLEPVTAGENVLRGETTSGINSRKTHCPEGHPLSGENLYKCRGRRQCRICRKRHKETYDMSGKRQKTRPPTDVQIRVLRVAVRNGRWWLAGNGAPNTARGLEQRGFATLHSELVAGRVRRYIVPTAEGIERSNGWNQ